MHSILPKTTPISQVQAASILRKLKTTHICPWCLSPSTNVGVCRDCDRRIELANVTHPLGLVLLPIHDLRKLPVDLSVMGLLQDEGAVACWTRPSLNGYAAMLGCSHQTIMRSLRRMVKLGWLEKRGSHSADYRLAIPQIE